MAKPTPPLERDILKACLDYLALIKVPAWRSNSGALKIDKRLVRFNGAEGCSDILGVLPRGPHRGAFLAVEVKRPGRKPTEKQQGFLDRIEVAGGVGLWVCSVGELEADLAELGVR